MTDLTLTKTQMRQGLWEGVLTGSADTPKLKVSHAGRAVDGVQIAAMENDAGFAVQIPIPAEAIADGMQTIVIADASSDDQIGAITLMAGEALADDMRVEVDLLRAELDMLKRAFRRHCLETD
ncbi:hypothetical protein [Sulfitobacter sp. S190]|uniref:hypothetical protein n=1 Tax=Sulfitobacter sp. S190 TaxID=2867022 RepID=UPI0021A36B6E|nr:hypothetical protein [Sulfitobacter sp. S190]UWR22300.1 hypothetical protein K3756_16790 [Sulfitobacter sp. S190]